jgi:hypothetical protein
VSDLRVAEFKGTREGFMIGANAIEERVRARKLVANQVLTETMGVWGLAVSDLKELIDMLGLHPQHDEEANRTLGRSVPDCSPVAETDTRRRARLRRSTYRAK